MNKRDKPLPKGWERHPLDPNLIRKIVAPPPMTIAQSLWPHLRSEYRPPIQPKKQERKR
jgi:hypothetical protein